MPPSARAAAARPADRTPADARIAIRLKPTAEKASGDPDDGIRQALARPLTALRVSVRIDPLLHSVEPRRLAAMIRQARELDSTYTPPRLAAWRQIVLLPEPGARLETELVDGLVRYLQKLDAVDSVYAMRAGPPPTTIRPGNDPRSAKQGYLDPAPGGIDARYAWAKGGTGAGIGFVDLEQGWKLDHKDLVAANITLISGLNKDYRPHGTRVLGVVRMVDNRKGGIGIAPNCTGRVISQHRNDGGENIADAITDAAAHMQQGDVLLLEAQETDPVKGTYAWPVEVTDGAYESIRLATALGIAVIEAGGNGSYNLDDYANAAGERIFDRNGPGFRDSLAVMVGAADSGVHARWQGSNYGSRIDCYGWGENVDTATTNEAGTTSSYEPNFLATSAASAIVAGAAVIVQSLASAGAGLLTPKKLRDALVAGGTPSALPAADRIGVMPNLRR